MKAKYSLGLLVYIILCLTSSCSGDDCILNGQSDQIIMTTKDFEFVEDSRTSLTITNQQVEFTWNENDVVGIFPEKGTQTKFPMTAGAGTHTATFNGGGWALKKASTYAAYYPYDFKNRVPKEIPITYDGQTQSGNATTSHLSNYSYMVASASTPANNSVFFNFNHLSSLIEITVNVPQKGDVTSLGLVSDSDIFTLKGHIDITSTNPSIVAYNKLNAIYVTLKDINIPSDNTPIKVYMMIAPGDFTDYNIAVEFVNNGKIYKEPIKLGNLLAGKAYRYSFTSQPIPDYANVFHVKEAGTLPQLIGKNDVSKFQSLKITGVLNGTDIRFLRSMLSFYSYNIELDLYDASIVTGGDTYLEAPHEQAIAGERYTENDVIGDFMFSPCQGLKKIILPKNTTSIGKQAFCNCSKLQDIKIPNNVSYIGEDAFHACVRLKNMHLPESIKYISEGAFSRCDSIKAFWGTFASQDNKSLIANNVLLAYASGTDDTSYEIPAGTKRIGYNAFTGSKLKTITIPPCVHTIGRSAFSVCSELTDINLTNGLSSIEDFAFQNTSIKEITIPNSVVILGTSIFNDCQQLESFHGKFSSTDNKCLIYKNSIIDYAHGSKETEYIINENISSIHDYAFSESSNLENVKIISPTIKSIGKYTFANCMKLKNVELTDNVERIGECAFSQCKFLTTINLPPKIKRIEKGTFMFCFRLNNLEIPNGITSFDDQAFWQCESFTSITFPESTEFIGSQCIVQGGYINLLSAIYCYAKTPPYTMYDFLELYDGNFVPRSCNIYVPAESVDAYKNTEPWCKYTILPITNK